MSVKGLDFIASLPTERHIAAFRARVRHAYVSGKIPTRLYWDCMRLSTIRMMQIRKTQVATAQDWD